MDNRWDRIPADAYVEILQRLPPCPRRRLRLVCRHWRSVIDDRTPATQARAMVLACVGGDVVRPRAYVFDDLSEQVTGGGRELGLQCVDNTARRVSMVGTCNGLVCLHFCQGDVVVVNPVTGEKLAVPPPSMSPEVSMDAAAYSFAYHSATGVYKIVHIPCHVDDGGMMFDEVKVFTLGDSSWLEVPVPAGSSCLLSFGLVSANGVMYWVSKDARSVMAFDLKDERVAFVTTLPVRVQLCLDRYWHLTIDTTGRMLGLAFCSYELKRGRTFKGSKTELWMMDLERNKRKGAWFLVFSVVEPGHKPLQEFAWPHVAHGEHVLTTRVRGSGSGWLSLDACRLRMGEARTTMRCGKAQMGWPPAISLYDDYYIHGPYAKTTEPFIRTFAYVEAFGVLWIWRWRRRYWLRRVALCA